jgi:ADP-heptose:LPS heptosyltransferase
MKILVISLAGIGDTLLATPLLRALREQRPDAVIDLVARWRGSRDLLGGNPNVNGVHQKNLVKGGILSNLRFLWSLRRQRYDVSINTHPQGKIAYRIVARVIGARLRLSHRYENHSIWDRLLVNRSIDQDYTIHCVDNSLRLLPLMGLADPARPLDIELYFSPEEEQWAQQFISSNRLGSQLCIGIHVGSGKTKNLMLKRWPIEHYIELIRSLFNEFPDVVVLLFGGPDESEDNQRILSQGAQQRLVVVNSQTMKQAAAVLRHCQIFVSVDNVFMHLAAAVNVPEQIVIESPTFNKTIEPYHRPFRLVPNPLVGGRNLEYYRYDGRDIQGGTEHLLACMRSVTPQAVLSAISDAIHELRGAK